MLILYNCIILFFNMKISLFANKSLWLGNIVEEPASQKRKLDDNNSNEQDIDQQEEEQQERSFKRTKVTEEYDEQSNKEHDGLEGWVLFLCFHNT